MNSIVLQNQNNNSSINNDNLKDMNSIVNNIENSIKDQDEDNFIDLE